MGWNFAAEGVGVYPSMFFEEGKEWGRARRLISPNLNGHNITAMLPIISKVYATALCKHLEWCAVCVHLARVEGVARVVFDCDLAYAGATECVVGRVAASPAPLLSSKSYDRLVLFRL